MRVARTDFSIDPAAMPAKPVFNQDQIDILHATARRVFAAQFEWMKADKKTGKLAGQEAMGLALGISQQTVSSLLKGKYNPGLKVARNLANLDGQTLEQLVGHFADPEPASTPQLVAGASSHMKGLEACIEFHSSIKTWSPWTIAAARAGYFGTTDYPAPQWTAKLDALEKALERARKAS